MFPLHVASRNGEHLNLLCVGAHCDDIEIGCGGTLLALQSCYPRLRIHWLILASDTRRRSEALRSRDAFVVPSSRGEIRVHDLPDGRLPAHFDEVKTHFEDFRSTVDPDWVMSHHGGDQHQDHALLSQITWQTFRNHAIWEYEVPKYDGDLATPNAYVPLPAEIAQQKVKSVVDIFRTQHDKSWFRAENLLAVMRLRGLECRADSGFAEGFHCRKLVFLPTAPEGRSTEEVALIACDRTEGAGK